MVVISSVHHRWPVVGVCIEKRFDYLRISRHYSLLTDMADVGTVRYIRNVYIIRHVIHRLDGSCRGEGNIAVRLRISAATRATALLDYGLLF